MRRIAATISFGLILARVALAQPVTLDDCNSLDHWKLIKSDGVDARLSLAEGVDGKALRLDFDFTKGSGFCVVRRDVAQLLGDNYRFGCDIRGEAPTNQLEFKLMDASGENVWWVRNGEFEFSSAWSRLTYKKRHFQFAWGPSGGKPIDSISAIEIAVAANAGGRGYLLLDRLTYEPLPVATAAITSARLLNMTPAENERLRPIDLPPDGALDWHSSKGVDQPVFRIDLQHVREVGGLAIEWDQNDYPVEYSLSALKPDESPLAEWNRQCSRGGREYIRIDPTEAQFLELEVKRSAGTGIGVKSIRVLPVEFAESLNAAYETIARDAPRGWYPRYFLGQQCYWTVVGVPDDAHEILLDQDGSVEIGKRGPRLEPFLFVNGKLLTWADAKITQSLDDGFLPIPRVERDYGDLTLMTWPIAEGPPADARASVNFRIINNASERRSGTLFIAGRPFQVLPPWQQLNLTGGAIRIKQIVANDQLMIMGGWPIGPWQRPDGFGVAGFADGDVVEYLAAGKLPPRQGLTDEPVTAGFAWRFDFSLPHNDAQNFVISIPMPKLSERDPCALDRTAVDKRFGEVLESARQGWRKELTRATLALPESARNLVNTFRSTQAYILINADGPATQPGSRTYERSWIRDGAVTATSMCYTGRTDRAVAFADWFSKYLYENGKVPCVVDRRGPDPVPENDSNGEYLYLLWRCYQFTRDRAFLERHIDHATAAVNYIDALRRQRMADQYRTGTPEQRACFGLMPESISHEGYSAKPMHSYWDDLWTLRGLKDAVRMATILHRDDLIERWTPIRDEFRAALGASLRLAMKNKKIDYLPGCVELGDFDATSTAVALFPCGDEILPQPELRNTFDRYYKFVTDRRDGKLDWHDYTPYEIRNVTAFLRLGQADRAHEALDFFMRDQRPAAWNHWAEVVWRDPNAPRFIGDMPHTWVGSEFLTAIRSFFVFEEDDADKLVLAAGVKEEWLSDGGTAIQNWPTTFGPLSYTLRRDGDRLMLELDFKPFDPPPTIEFHIPGQKPILEIRVNDVEMKWTGRTIKLPSTKCTVAVKLAN